MKKNKAIIFEISYFDTWGKLCRIKPKTSVKKIKRLAKRVATH